MFTVIIPTYNHAHFLKRSVRSVIEQTFSDWECIIVDNHSTDETEEVVASFDDSRLRLLKIHNNGIIAASRNLGIATANREWVAFLDSDDFWCSSKLADVATEIARRGGDLDVVSTDEIVVAQGHGPRTTLRYGPYCEEFYKAMLIDGNRLSTSATVVRRQFMKGNSLRFREDREFLTVEDYDLWLRIARAGARFSFLRSVGGEYLLHGSNSSGNVERHHRNLKAMLHAHVYRIQDFTENKDALWQQVLVRVLLTEAKAWLSAGDLKKGVNLTFAALSQGRFSVIRFLISQLRRRTALRLSRS